MQSLEEMINLQSQRAEEVSRLLANIRKDGADRKNRADYWRKREKEFKVLVNAYKFDHANVKGIPGEKTHYLSEYEQTSGFIRTLGEIIRKGIEETDGQGSEGEERETEGAAGGTGVGTQRREAKEIAQAKPIPSTSAPVSVQTTSGGKAPSDPSNWERQGDDTQSQNKERRSLLREWVLLKEELLHQTDLKEIRAPKLLETIFTGLKSLQKELRLNYASLMESEHLREEQKTAIMEDHVHLSKLILKALTEIATRVDDRRQSARLPAIELIKFNGEPQNWLPFRQLFEQMVHNRKDISDTEKMSYLRSNVSHEAWDAIKHFRSDLEQNYLKAWNHLNERFLNSRKIVQAEIENLFSLPRASNVKTIKQQYNMIVDCLESLRGLKVDTSTWDPILNRLIIQKWDSETIQLFEQRLEDSKKTPTIKMITAFLLWRIDTFQPTSQGALPQQARTKTLATTVKKTKKKSKKSKGKTTCIKCQQDHPIWTCPEFSGMPVKDRIRFIADKEFCRVCLSHPMNNPCRSKYLCKTCKEPHSSLLHDQEMKSFLTKTRKECVFPTAIVTVENTRRVVALFDNCANANFITKSLVQDMGLESTPTKTHFSGLSDKTALATEKVRIRISNHDDTFAIRIDAYIIDEILKNCPDTRVPAVVEFKDLGLANPQYNEPTNVQLLLGAAIVAKILKPEFKRKQNTMAQSSVFGWMISGETNSTSQHEQEPHALVTTTENDNSDDVQELQSLVKKMINFLDFDADTQEEGSEQEDPSVDHFARTTKKTEEGRYIVKMALKTEPNGRYLALGVSYNQALQRWLAMEKRMQRDEHLREEYHKCLQKYIELGHMSEYKPEPYDPRRPNQVDFYDYFLPHHAVVKQSSLTTKVRVVFDGSAKTSNGRSVNDLQYAGPVVQNEILLVIIGWRLHPFVFGADVKMMFRQIVLDADQRRYQQIVYRERPTEPLRHYTLNRVTFGQRSAPFLAASCVVKTGKDCLKTEPLAAEILINGSYVDNFFGGAQDKETAMEAIRQLTRACNRVHFPLSQWTANDPSILADIPKEEKVETIMEIPCDSVKTLGVLWDPKHDQFRFECKFDMQEGTKLTKRIICSKISSIYDPEGLLIPYTMNGKAIIQEMWKHNLTWDETVPPSIARMFEDFVRLGQPDKYINKYLEIPRYVNVDLEDMYIHGFCDASKDSYACCIYIGSRGRKHSLIYAKHRTTPKKIPQIIARNELNGMVLCVEAMDTVMKVLGKYNPKIELWCDSQVALAWVQGVKNHDKWPTYVRNRVRKIAKSSYPIGCWNYVDTKENPADLATRLWTGKTRTVFDCLQPLWLEGPGFLRQGIGRWPEKRIFTTCVKQTTPANLRNEPFILLEQLEALTSFDLIVRTIGIIMRCKDGKNRTRGQVTAEEYERAFTTLMRLLQKKYFPVEYMKLANHSSRGPNSTNNVGGKQINTFNPFMDFNGIIRGLPRTGEASSLSDREKTPIIFPTDSPIAYLLAKKAHELTLHGQVSLTTKWITAHGITMKSIRLVVKKAINKCKVCWSFSKIRQTQLMGMLPTWRVNISHPFTVTALDYCGPFVVRDHAGQRIVTRSNRTDHEQIRHKAYICVFVCMTTRAIHLELSSDLTTASFTQAFNRFTARRGTPAVCISDNGTNFKGATNQKTARYKFLQVVNVLEQQVRYEKASVMRWYFIPPLSPHFNGISESGVKSVKYHLKRLLENEIYTYEEFNTLIVRVEGILNSRPLCKGRLEDPITAGHFLTGRAIMAPPENQEYSPTTSLERRYANVEKKAKEFWTVWERDVLFSLSKRPKWNVRKNNLQVGDLVLIKGLQTKMQRWPLGVITVANPNKDGFVRKVTIRTKEHYFGEEVGQKIRGKDYPSCRTIERSVHDLVLLPSDDNETDDEKVLTLLKGGLHAHGNSDVKLVKSTEPSTERDPRLTYEDEPEAASDEVIERAPKEVSSPKRGTKRKMAQSTILLTIMLFIGSLLMATATQMTTVKGGGIFISHLGQGHMKSADAKVRFTTGLNPRDDQETCERVTRRYKEMCQQVTKTTNLTKCLPFQASLIEDSSFVKRRMKRSHGLLGALKSLLVGSETSEEVDELARAQAQTKLVLVKTLKHMSETESKIYENMEVIGNVLTETQDKLRDIQYFNVAINETMINTQVLEMFETSRSVLRALEHRYELVSKSDFVSSEELFSEIDTLLRNLSDSKVMETKKEEFAYKVVHDESGYLIIEFEVPIVSTIDFDVVKVSPLPGLGFIIDIRPQYLIIDHTSIAYASMDKLDFIKYIVKNGTINYILPSTPLRRGEQQMTCAAASVLNPNQAREICKIRELEKTFDSWTQVSPLHETFIFYTSYPSAVHIFCGQTREEITATQGYVRLSPGCVLQTQTMKYQATASLTRNKHKKFLQPLQSLVRNDTLTILQKIQRNETTLNISKLNNSQIIDLIAEAQTIPDPKHGTIYIALGSTMIVVLAIMLIFVYRMKTRRNQREEIPTLITTPNTPDTPNTPKTKILPTHSQPQRRWSSCRR